MNGLEVALLRRRIEVLESVIAQSGLLDAIAGGGWGGVSPVADPAPEDIGRGVGLGPVAGSAVGRIPPRGDPPPIDIGRLSRVQLQAVLHDIAAQRARLDSMEALTKEHLDQLGGGGS